MTLSTKGKVVIETSIYDNDRSVRNAINTLNVLLSDGNTDLQFDIVQDGPHTPTYHIVRLISLKELFLPDILEDPDIKYIVLNPAPKTPQCKEFLEGSTLMGKKEDFIDFDLTPYKAFEIGHGKIHFRKKD